MTRYMLSAEERAEKRRRRVERDRVARGLPARVTHEERQAAIQRMGDAMRRFTVAMRCWAEAHPAEAAALGREMNKRAARRAERSS